jgi:DNA-binding NtrC family response regulator
VIEAADLNLAQRTGASRQEPAATYDGLTLAELERQHIARVLEEEDGKVAQAAIKLGIPRSTLYQKIKVYGLQTTTTVSQ